MLYFQAKLQSKTVYCFKIAYSCCFGLRGNLGELLEEKPSAFPKFCSLMTAFWFWRLWVVDWEVEIRNIQSTHSASLLQISKETLNPLTSSTQYLLHCCALERTLQNGLTKVEQQISKYVLRMYQRDGIYRACIL